MFHELLALCLANADRVAELLAEGTPTLVHGDSHIGNMLRHDDDPILIDWAMVSCAPGLRDVAYFIGNSVPPEVRREHEQQLLRRYLAALAERGVDIPYDEAWDRYRLHMVTGWIAAVATAGMGDALQPIEIGMRATERSNLAIEDLERHPLAAPGAGLIPADYWADRPEVSTLPAMRNPHAGEPFDTPDDEIAAALLDLSIPTLMLSLVHMSGDAELIRGRLAPAGVFINEVQGFMTDEDKAQVRALALDVIRDYRDRGCPEPEPIDGALIHEMMRWIVAGDVPDEYVPLMLEELELDGSDTRRVDRDLPARDREAFPVVIIGCGESGLLAGIRLKEAGIPFTIVEKNTGVGGTWWENSYPGAARRRRQPLLLLQLRAIRPLDRVLCATTRAPGVLRGRHAEVRRRRPRAVGDRSHRARSGTTPTTSG